MYICMYNNTVYFQACSGWFSAALDDPLGYFVIIYQAWIIPGTYPKQQRATLIKRSAVQKPRRNPTARKGKKIESRISSKSVQAFLDIGSYSILFN